MKLNEIYRVDIIDTNESGVGIAKVDGAVVFVPTLCKGDTADIRITIIKKNYAIGECVELIHESEHRLTPECPHSSDCGGCSLCHVTYEHENEIKRNTVKSAFRRAALPYDIVGETAYAPQRTSYRNKIVLHYSDANKVFGLYRENTNEVVPFEHCMLCPTITNEIIKFINENISLIAGTSPESLQIRTNTSEAVTVSLYSRVSDNPRFREALVDEFPKISQVVFVNTSLKSKGERHYSKDSLMGLDLIFSTDGFRQVNDGVFEIMIGMIREYAAEINFSTALDLYCGSGVIGLMLAKHFPEAHFYGVEINTESVKDAKKNAEANGIRNIEFFCGDAAEFRKNLPNGKKAELAVVDPPRAGLSDCMRQELIALSPERIIYVSCNPQTLARDLADITKNGYEMRTAIPLNMFPMTKHCECVVMLCRESCGHQMKLHAQPFEKIKSGKKTIELRLWDEKRRQINIGDTIVFTNTSSGEKLHAAVTVLHRFDSFEELYKALPLMKCGYTEDDIDTAKPSDMDMYYSLEEQARYGVVGIEIAVIK